MSGLAAVVGSDRNRVREMLAAAPYRGSDVEVTELGAVSLGVQRVAGEEPFTGASLHSDPKVAVGITGCLYRGDGIVSGREAAKRCAETYLSSGPAAVAKLDGAFAVVIADASGAMVAIRSAIGERPLFWRIQDGRMAVASETKQLWRGRKRPQVDIDAVLDVVAMRGPDLATTAYADIQRVLPGEWLQVRDGVVERGRTWDPTAELGARRMKLEDAVVEFRTRLRTAVARRLREGTGVLMSGGLDSTAIAAEAAPLHRERYGRPLRVVSARYPEVPSVDESRFVQMTAERLGLEVAWTEPKPRPFDDIEFEAALHDAPSIAPLGSNFRQILSGARGYGITALMDGHDGDGIFGGTTGLTPALLRRGRFDILARMVRFDRRTLREPWLRSLLRPMQSALPGLRDVATRLGLVAASTTPPWIVSPLRERCDASDAPSTWSDAAVRRMSLVTLALELIERIGAFEGVTLTHPLADVDVVRFALGLAPELSFATGAPKSILRAGYPEVPPEVGLRRKMVFNALAEAGAPASEVREALHRDWMLPGIVSERRGAGDLGMPERALARRALSAEAFLATAASPSAGSRLRLR